MSDHAPDSSNLSAVRTVPPVVRIVCTGSESTGKSTLAGALARHYAVELVPEFVRAFVEEISRPIDFSDHGAIARGQMALEDTHLARAGRLLVQDTDLLMLVQDTDLLSTVVYCRHYFGRCPAWIEEAAVARRPELYLLCEPDIPWVADGVRDREHARDQMQTLFTEAVAGSGTPFRTIGGDARQRLARAIEVIEEHLAT